MGGHPGGTRDYSKNPFIVFWEVTRSCELACRHCRAEAVREPDPDELGTEEGKKLVNELTEFDKTPILVLTGGDPLMREDIFELVEYAVDSGIRTAFTPAPTSNLDEESIRKLKQAGVGRLALSLDGSTAERHDSIRGVEGSFESVMKSAEICDEVGLPLQINSMVTEESVEDLENLAELVEETGAVLWSLFFLVPVGRAKLMSSIPPEKAEEVMEFLYRQENKRSFQTKTTEATHYRRVKLQNSPKSLSSDEKINRIGRSYGVNDGNGVVFVSRVGDIYPSGFLPEKTGNVREDSLVEIYRNSEVFKELRDNSMLKGECGRCRFKVLCGGSRARAYAVTGDYLEEDPLCAYEPEEN